jgi:hypothetical protein
MNNLMKPFLIFAAVCAFSVAVSQSGRADVSVNFFYDNLNGGNWYEVADYGYVWQPDAATNPDWRPYTDGYWAYTDVGWTWVSYEDFGWATYHYGRWIRLEDYGWCWVPGYEWGPAWVSWRTGGDYIGWAPLPPAGPRGEIVYESRPIGGHVDVDFGIGPAYYNFIDIRYIGEPVLIGHYHPYAQNVVYINNTVNVTNITYNNSIVYNYGPDYAVLSRYSTRPIQRLKLERTNIDPLQAVKGGNVTKVQGDKLVLAAPLKVQKPATPVAPKAIKAKIAQPKVEKGWANIADPGTKAKLEQKFRTENPKNVPPPTIQPTAATANVSPVSSPGSSPFEKGKGKGKGETLQNQAGAPVGPATSPGSFEQERGKKGKQQRFESEAAVSTAPGSSPATESFEQGKGKHKGQRFENESTVSGGPASSSPAGYSEQNKGKKKGQRFENESAVSGAPASSSPTEYPEQGKGKKKGRGEYGEQNSGAEMSPQSSNRNLQNENNPDYGKHKGNRQGENAQSGSESSGGGPSGGNKHREQSQSQVQPQRGQYGQPEAGQGQRRGGQHGQQQGGQQQGGQQQGAEGRGKGKKASPTPPPQ